MDEKTIVKKMVDGKVETIKNNSQFTDQIKNLGIQTNDDLYGKLRSQRKELSSTPTKPVTSFIDQIQFFDGNMMAFFNDQWNTIGAGSEFKTSNITRASTTGDQAITGVGFEPKAIIIIAYATGGDSSMSFGFATSSSNMYVLERYYNGTNWAHLASSSNCIYTRDTSSNTGRASLKSFDSDGFTLNWNESTNTINAIYLCIS